MEKSAAIFRTCQICSAPASFINFGIPSCSSCKMFFKRNAHFGKDHFICESDNHCEINIRTRRLCSRCRLAKCFASGMQIELIRCSRPRKKVVNQLQTLSLLRSDQSRLTVQQWTLLSNLINCYDQYCGLTQANRFISEQSILPTKLRYKIEPVGEFVTSNISQVQKIFEKNQDLNLLNSSDRLLLLEKTVKHTGCIGATYILYQSHLLDDPIFYQTNEIIFTSDVMSTIKPLIDTFDTDIIIIKLTLTIIAFSTTSYTIFTPDTSIRNFLDIKTILSIQDNYTEILWKYLIYKYTYEQSIKHFCKLLRCLFHVNFTIVEADRIQQYTNMIDTVIQQTQDLLIK